MTKPELEPTQIVRREDFAKITANITKALDGEFSKLNADTRKKLLENVEDLLGTAFNLATGITIQKFETDRRTGHVEEVIYSVPPYWPVIKYFLEWFREIAQADTDDGLGLGLDDPNVREFLRGVLSEKPDITPGVVEDLDGVRHLLPAPVEADDTANHD